MGLSHREHQKKKKKLNRTKQGLETFLHSIPCLYTNADHFKGTFLEFSVRANNEQLMLITIK